MAMNEKELWIGLAVGFVPYHVERQCLACGSRKLEVRALFWSLRVHWRRSGRHDWKLSVPLIERLRDAVWAAVTRLQGKESP
jgi:hypothetical protein